MGRSVVKERAGAPASRSARARTAPHRGRRRRVAVLTGTRAEYGLLRTALAAIAAHPALDLRLIVAGAHLLPRFGHTIDQIRADGWRIDCVAPMQAGDDDPLDPARAVARGVPRIARFLIDAACDDVLVLGDRVEALAGALAAATTGRRLAHVHGGDVAPGDFDDKLRDAITMLADLHLPATQAAARRIRAMRGAAAQIRVVGAPGLDRLAQILREDRSAREERGASAPPAPRDAYALVVQHAYGRSAAEEERIAARVLRAVRRAGLRRRILLPNTDRGNAGVLRAIERHVGASRAGEAECAGSLAHDAYLREMLRARVVVGNSSSGIIEAPFAGTPSVNVGERQAGRLPGGTSVVHVDERESSILAGIRRALRLPRGRARRGPYGDGRAGERIARAVAEL